MDVIAPARRDGGEDLSLRMVGTLLVLLDEINKNDRVLIIAATNRPDSIDPALRRLGRLEREIEIGTFLYYILRVCFLLFKYCNSHLSWYYNITTNPICGIQLFHCGNDSSLKSEPQNKRIQLHGKIFHYMLFKIGNCDLLLGRRYD